MNPPVECTVDGFELPIARSAERRRSALVVSVSAALVLSGFASLVYQVVWQRVLSQTVGVDAISMAIVVTIFLIGFAVGGQAGAALCKLDRRVVGTAYVAAEILIGTFGFASVPLLRWVSRASAVAGFESFQSDFLFNGLALLAPAAAMGLTTPLAVELISPRRDGAICTSIGLLYGLNVMGAAIGALAAGFILIEWLGLSATTRLTAWINLFVGVLLLWTLRIDWSNPNLASAASITKNRSISTRLGPTIVAASVLLGFVTLSFETVLFRLLSFHFESHVYVFPLMLGGFLAAMSLGDAVSGFVVDKIGPSRLPRYFAIILFVFVGGVCLAFRWPTHASAADWIANRPRAALLFVAFLIPVMAQSAFFPAVARMARGLSTHPGSVVGRILFWYTIGNGLGCFLTAFVFLPSVGTVGSATICLVAGAVAVMLLYESSLRISGRHASRYLLIGSALLLGSVFLPYGYYKNVRGLAEVREGPEGVVSYRDGKNQGGIQVNGTPAAQVYRNTRGLRKTEHDLSLLKQVDPRFRPRRVLVVGIGSANFPWALREDAEVEELMMVELSCHVVELLRKYSDPEIVQAIDDPKVRFVWGDGRRYLERMASHGESFDVIQVGTFFPDVAGSATLYSRDLMTTARTCLKPGGYFITLDCAGIALTGLEVFRNGMLVDGMPHYMFFFDHDLSLRRRAEDDEKATNSVCVRFLQQFQLKDYSVNSDDRPWLEFRLLRHLSGDRPELRARLHRMPPSRFAGPFCVNMPDDHRSAQLGPHR